MLEQKRLIYNCSRQTAASSQSECLEGKVIMKSTLFSDCYVNYCTTLIGFCYKNDMHRKGHHLNFSYVYQNTLRQRVIVIQIKKDLLITQMSQIYTSLVNLSLIDILLSVSKNNASSCFAHFFIVYRRQKQTNNNSHPKRLKANFLLTVKAQVLETISLTYGRILRYSAYILHVIEILLPQTHLTYQFL